MDNIDLMLLLLVGGGMALLVIVAITKYLMDFYSDIKYVKMEMGRAYDWNEYVYWRRELRDLRWCIIPGMTMDRVKAIKRNIKSLFVRGKYEKKKDKSDGFISMLLPSVLGICLCAVCLVGGTFAWFTASQSTATQTIQAANYDVTTVITHGNETPITTQNGVYHLEKSDTAYRVTLTATGDASTGYCIIDFGGTDIHTVQFPTESSNEKNISFNLLIYQSVDMKIIPQWGSSTRDSESKIANDGTYTHGENTEEIIVPPSEESDKEITEPTTDTTESTTTEETTPTAETTLDPTQYTVKSGDSLSKIATMYGESVERLQAYNNIENPSQIYAGQVIKIPPAGWQIPEITTTEETTSPPTTEPTETTSQTEATTEPDETTTVHEETTGTIETQSESEGNE